ncbi:MAG: hypothetical protein ACOVT5_11880 [Armatimonadaceae bacterium]|jgi:hypothetical protein
MSQDLPAPLQEKINEYRFLIAPVENAIRDLQLTRGMLRARAEDEIHAISPALATISEALGISTLDLLTAPDRDRFLREAVERSQVPIDSLRERVLESGGGEQLKAIGLPESD